MTENFKKFLETVSRDAALVEKMNQADKADFLAVAKELGLELTEEDLRMPETKELSEDELEAVSGGGGCPCFLSGGGVGDGLVCFCAGPGGGFVDKNSYCSGAGDGACACTGLGAGATNGRECHGSWVNYNSNHTESDNQL